MNLAQFEARLRQLPCVVGVHAGQGCPCEALHHVGMPPDRDDMNQVPICHAHHQGPLGVHGLHRREFEMRYRLSDLKMLALTRRMYLREFGA